jgi:hypothetical protein
MNTSSISSQFNNIRKPPKTLKKPLLTAPKIPISAQIAPAKETGEENKSGGSTNALSSTTGNVLNTHA